MSKDTQVEGLMKTAERVWRWQYNGLDFPVHEMTCGGTIEGEDCRSVLSVGIEEDKVFMFCRICGYIQDWIPGPVLRMGNDE